MKAIGPAIVVMGILFLLAAGLTQSIERGASVKAVEYAITYATIFVVCFVLGAAAAFMGRKS